MARSRRSAVGDEEAYVEPPAKRTRVARNFPSAVYKESEDFAKSVYQIGGGQTVRRMTLFAELGKSPTSSASQILLTNAAKYGLTKGSYKSEFVELTALGETSVSDTAPSRERERSRIQSAILSVPPFKDLYESLIDAKLPSKPVLADKMKELGVSDDAALEAIDTFIVNLREVGLLKTIAGAERIISVDMRLDEVSDRATPSSIGEQTGSVIVPDQATPSRHQVITSGEAHFATTAFYVSPIGSDGSDTRKHADLFASSIVEPALAQSKLRLVRADQIEHPGIITRQILEYIIHARLVIADLSFHNPNVFYELAIRHIMKKPTVQIMRRRDTVPFDINQSRTIMIDDTDIYSLVPQIPVYVSSIAAQVRQALENPDSVDSPISVYFPSLAASLKSVD